MPVSIRKPSSQNKVRLDLICIEDVTLPDTTFGKTIKTVRQRWVKTDTLREKIATFTTHPDFEFVKKSDTPDCMIFRCGASTGKIVFEFEDNKPDHYYIKASSVVIQNLRDIQDELIEISKEQNGMPGISKHDLITTYIKRYGRSKVEMYYSHPDLEFVSYDERHDANVFIGIKGGGPGGRVKTENFEHYADTGHHLIRCSKKVQERLVALEPQFREEALITQVPSLGKNELISIYMKNYPTCL